MFGITGPTTLTETLLESGMLFFTTSNSVSLFTLRKCALPWLDASKVENPCRPSCLWKPPGTWSLDQCPLMHGGETHIQ